MRSQESRPIFERIYRILEWLKKSGKYLPKSTMGTAVDYALNEWPKLGIHLQDGRIEIDNNLVENAIRPAKLGERNWLFIGQAQAGQRAAILYTIVQSCRRHGVEIERYLRDVFIALPELTTKPAKDWAKDWMPSARTDRPLRSIKKAA